MKSSVLLSVLLLGVGSASLSLASNPTPRRALTPEEKKLCENSIVDDGKMDAKKQALLDKQLETLCSDTDPALASSLAEKKTADKSKNHNPDTEGDSVERLVPVVDCENCPDAKNRVRGRLLDETTDGSRPPRNESLKKDKTRPPAKPVKR